MMKLRSLLALLCALALLAAACTSDNTPDTLVVSEGRLVVGTSPTFEPFEFLEDGTPVGFDIDLVTELADRLGLEVDLQTTGFETLLDDVADGTFDLGVAAITINERRKAVVAFSQPYFVTNQAVVVLSDGPKSLDDLAGGQVGVEIGSTSLDAARAQLPKQARLVEFPTSDAAFAAVESGQIVAAVVDYPTAAERVEASGKQLTVLEELETGEQYGIAIAPDNEELAASVNEHLAALIADGTYEEIYGRWFTGAVPKQFRGQDS
jgi:polar amino acid transport system substrate-binding protein